jgi:hypothetical protein
MVVRHFKNDEQYYSIKWDPEHPSKRPAYQEENEDDEEEKEEVQTLRESISQGTATVFYFTYVGIRFKVQNPIQLQCHYILPRIQCLLYRDSIQLYASQPV